MKKLTKTQVIKKVREQGSLTVELFSSNCSPQNLTWIRGFDIELTFNNNGAVVYFDGMNHIPFESVIANFQHYNCNAELGNRVHYYIQD